MINHVDLNRGKDPRPDPLGIRQQFPWIESGLLTRVISQQLEIKDLIKLIPEKARPKRHSTLAAGTSIIIDEAAPSGSSLKVLHDNSTTTYERDIQDSDTLFHIISVYSAIRGAYDTEHTNIAVALACFLRQLIDWLRTDGIPFSRIRAYFVAHFQLFQTSQDPADWMKIDNQSFLRHMQFPALRI
jgi:hypothetical protein